MASLNFNSHFALISSNTHTNSGVVLSDSNRTNYAGGQSANIVLRCKTTRMLLSTFLLIFLFMMASVGLMAQTPINLTDICIEGQPDSCLPGWTQGRYTLPYILPGYPDCKIILIYAMRTCTTSGGKIINQIVGQKIYTNFDPDDDCYELHKYITTGPDGNHMEEGNPAAISKIFNEGFRVAADSWFAVFKNQYPCEADIFQFYATYYRGSCVKYCTQTCIEENIMTTIITELNCQGIACCKIERKYCYDTETGETNVEETTTSHDPYYKPIPPGNPQHFTFMCGYEDPLSPVSCPELSHSCCIQKQTPCHKVCED